MIKILYNINMKRLYITKQDDIDYFEFVKRKFFVKPIMILTLKQWDDMSHKYRKITKLYVVEKNKFYKNVYIITEVKIDG